MFLFCVIPLSSFYLCSFIVKDWGTCSVPCGEGIRKREVICQIFLEFSKTVATLPDHKCPGPKPPTTEICFAGLCDIRRKPKVETNPPLDNSSSTDDNLQPKLLASSMDLRTNYRRLAEEAGSDFKSYEWRDAGWTKCSETCLGGLQESKIICVEMETGNPMAPVHCRDKERPEVIVRTCNDHPCPPRWNVSEFTVCSKSCGGGIQTRTVSCIQEVRHGGNNILKVDDSFCPQPPPINQQFCNIVDCPVKWNTGPWTKVRMTVRFGGMMITCGFQCSQECGGGFKSRKVRCQQLLALGEVANKPSGHCPKDKPDSEKECNRHDCAPGRIFNPFFFFFSWKSNYYLQKYFFQWK